jgi:hypothetical protein
VTDLVSSACDLSWFAAPAASRLGADTIQVIACGPGEACGADASRRNVVEFTRTLSDTYLPTLESCSARTGRAHPKAEAAGERCQLGRARRVGGEFLADLDAGRFDPAFKRMSHSFRRSTDPALGAARLARARLGLGPARHRTEFAAFCLLGTSTNSTELTVAIDVETVFDTEPTPSRIEQVVAVRNDAGVWSIGGYTLYARVARRLED